MIKQLRTSMSLKAEFIESRKEALDDYCWEVMDLRCDNMTLDEILAVYHWRPVYDKDGNIETFLYTADDFSPDDFDVVALLMSETQNPYVDLLDDGKVLRYCFQGYGYCVYNPGYTKGYLDVENDKELSETRDKLLSMNIKDLVDIYNTMLIESGQYKSVLHDIKEINVMWGGLSPLETVKMYGTYHEALSDNPLYFSTRKYQEDGYVYYTFYNEEEASCKVLMSLKDMCRFVF